MAVTLRGLVPSPVWVDPDHTLSTASHLMRGYGLRAIGVARGGRILGILEEEIVAAAPAGWQARDVMSPPPPSVELSATPREAARALLSTRSTWLAVTDLGYYYGLIEIFDLVDAVAATRDPLTGLPGSDELRAWAADRLAEEEEIAMIFVDLNDFGALNRKLGHALGDRTLRAVAEHLDKFAEAPRDLLCRFGGDEFAIATLRPRMAAEGLASALGTTISVPEIGRVTFTVGVAGGRREGGRPDVHGPATVDDLINQASLAGTAAKPAPAPVPNAVAEIRVIGVFPGDVSTVVLGQGQSAFSGYDSGPGGDEDRVARATARALGRKIPNLTLELDRLAVISMEGATTLNLTGELRIGDKRRPLRIATRTESDPMMAVAESTVAAIIREAPEAASA